MRKSRDFWLPDSQSGPDADLALSVEVVPLDRRQGTSVLKTLWDHVRDVGEGYTINCYRETG
jgi:hypothetical protein